jgi:hypothetical protein
LAYQLSDLITKVQNKIKDTGFSSSVITDFINDAQFDLFNEYGLPAMEASHNYTLSPGSSDITAGAGLPTDYVIAKDVILTTAGYEKQLPYRDIESLDFTHPDQDDTTRNPANVPRYWYFFAETPRVYPAPNIAHTITLRYEKTPTELSDSTDVPDVPANFREFLVLAAAGRVMEVKDNYDQAAYLLGRADTLARKLVSKYSRKQTGQVRRMPINRVAHNATGK